MGEMGEKGMSDLLKETWTRDTACNRLGAKICDKCGMPFVKDSLISIHEISVSFFRGDDEVSFYHFPKCTPSSAREAIK